MALASWIGLYTPVTQSLMRQKRIKELICLQAIAGHADPFGFAWPGSKALRGLMRCSQSTLDKLIAWLAENDYIKVYNFMNPRRGRLETDYQINPRVLYVREEIQAYCEALWSGAQRDFEAEAEYRRNLFSTKDSQPESESESETDAVKQSQNHHHHQTRNAPRKQSKRDVLLYETAPATPQNQGDSPTSQRNAQNSKKNPQAGAATPGQAATLANVDAETLAQEIKLRVGTQISQAREAVASYSRAEIALALELTCKKRDRGELKNPGGYFFATLKNGIIDPAQDADQIFPPRPGYDLDELDRWNPETASYEARAAGD